MGNCCSCEMFDVGRLLFYEKLGENGEWKEIDEIIKILEMEISELNGDVVILELFNVE